MHPTAVPGSGVHKEAVHNEAVPEARLGRDISSNSGGGSSSMRNNGGGGKGTPLQRVIRYSRGQPSRRGTAPGAAVFGTLFGAADGGVCAGAENTATIVRISCAVPATLTYTPD